MFPATCNLSHVTEFPKNEWEIHAFKHCIDVIFCSAPGREAKNKKIVIPPMDMVFFPTLDFPPQIPPGRPVFTSRDAPTVQADTLVKRNQRGLQPRKSEVFSEQRCNAGS